MDNVERSRLLIAALADRGVREVCVCAGSRNSPLLAVLGASDVRLFSFVDERSATFFAIGRSKLHGLPVAVVTTSGTAVAEMLPGAIEAYYSGIPLVLISADRPARFRGTGAPQSIEQEGIFGVYAETSLETWSGTKPLHINVEFDEPLIDGSNVIPSVARDLGGGRHEAADSRTHPPRSLTHARDDMAGMRHPLVIIGGLDASRVNRVRALVKQLNAPTYAEPLSQLREDSSLPLLTSGERILNRATFDRVIRIGNVPTLRFWRDLEGSDVPVAHYSDLPFTGLTRGELHSIDDLPDVEAVDRNEELFALDRRQAAKFAEILENEPESELALFRRLSTTLPENTRVYLGNSLPIREWDLAATRAPRGFTYEANRGANGIDGQLSTFFGQCDAARDNVCVVGDLTAIYDLNAPWIVPQLDAGTRFRLVIMNNGGGRIFSRVASLRAMDAEVRARIVENVHGVRFEHFAKMWDIDVEELVPDEEASRRVWRRYDELWA